MASSLKLKNNLETEFNIIHEDNAGAIEVSSYDLSRVKTVETIAALRASNNPQPTVWVSGYHTKGDGAFGSNIFEWDSASTESDNGGTIIKLAGVETGRYKLRYSGAVNVKWFGAKGDSDETLYPVSYDTDFDDSITILSQTADAIAINSALNYIRNYRSGKTLYFPIGVYRTNGYLEKIDFPLCIRGESRDETIIKTCDDTPTNINGMGILVVNSTVNTEFKILDITLDGNAKTRLEPNGEFRSYNLAIYGNPKALIINIKSINSPIDCFYISYTTNELNSVNVYASQFIDSFRNTISLVSGSNQYWHGCLVSGGGFVHSGTNPRFCLDIEPNVSSNPIKNLKFNSCTFERAKNVIIGGTWAEANFSQCSIHAEGSEVAGYPWGFTFGQSEVTLDNCSINGKIGESTTICKSSYTDTVGAFKNTQYLNIQGCKFIGAGLHMIGKKTSITNTDFINSGYPVLGGSSDTGRKHEIIISNVNLVNVIDKYNASSGAFSSFAILSSVEVKVVIDGLNVMIEEDSYPSELLGVNRAFGIYLNASGALTSEFIVKNVHSSGFYKKLPLALGASENAGFFRDWSTPNLAPADTVGTTTTPNTLFYRSCTMLGNN